jgi:ethanolamine permease
VIGGSDEPLFEGFKTIFGAGLGSRVLALVAVAGLIASFHTIIYAYGRQIYSLSRAGYFPQALSLTHSNRKTPHMALIAGAMIGYVIALVIHFAGSDSPVGGALLNMAVFGAVIAYILSNAFLHSLAETFSTYETPLQSPLGMAGAWFALLVSSSL